MQRLSRLSGSVAAIAGVAGIGALALVATPAAASTLEIGISNTLTSSPSSVVTGSGTLSDSGTAGGWSYQVNATGNPPLANPALLNSTNTDLTFNSAGAACAGGTYCLYLYVTETGLTGPAGVQGFTSGLTVNTLPAGFSTLEQTYFSPSNTAFALTDSLGSFASTGIGTSTPGGSGTIGGSGTYSVTEVYEVIAPSGATAGQQALMTIDLATTPLPSTWTMLIASLLGLGLFAYRGSKRRSQGVSMLGATTA
jgi:hypothetical protein